MFGLETRHVLMSLGTELWNATNCSRQSKTLSRVKKSPRNLPTLHCHARTAHRLLRVSMNGIGVILRAFSVGACTVYRWKCLVFPHYPRLACMTTALGCWSVACWSAHIVRVLMLPAVGVCLDSTGEGKLNDKSVLFEGSRDTSNGERVEVNLGDVPDFSLFPGQVYAHLPN